MISEYTLGTKDLIKQRVKQFIRWVKREKKMVVLNGRFNNYRSAAKYSGGGYAEAAIFDRVSKSALAVKEGKACYERDGYLFYKKEYYLQLMAIFLKIYLEEGKLYIVDFGGSLGSTYFQNKDMLLPYVGDLTWNIIEQKHFVDFGKANLGDEVLNFNYALEEIKDYNCVLFGGSLQYIENYREYLEHISQMKCNYIVLDRVAVSDETWYSIECIHEIYEASYPIIIFNEYDLIALLESLGYKLQVTWIKDYSEVWQLGRKVMKLKTFVFHLEKQEKL